MKKKDALNILTAMKKSYMALGIPDPEAVEALELAINAVKAEPCEDAISRQAVLDLAKKGVLVSNDSYKSVSRFIYDLPSVNHVKINDIYPLTIIRDRYNDVYSGGKYLAFNLDADEIPTEIWGDDVECREFFYKVEQGRNDILIGKGHTIEEAVINLQEKMNE
jgi:hypothetical protein